MIIFYMIRPKSRNVNAFAELTKEGKQPSFKL